MTSADVPRSGSPATGDDPETAAARGPSGGPEYEGGRAAIVRIDGTPVGRLTESRDRRFVLFRYDAAYLARTGAVPVSLTLPLSPEPVETWGLHPFFRNLLPEGWLLDLAVRKLRVHETDELGLLVATGADCAGAVEVVPDHEVGGGGIGAAIVEAAGRSDRGAGEPPFERDAAAPSGDEP